MARGDVAGTRRGWRRWRSAGVIAVLLFLAGCRTGLLVGDDHLAKDLGADDHASVAMDADVAVDAAMILDLRAPADFAETLTLGCGADFGTTPCGAACACAPDHAAAIIAYMAEQPIILPNHAAGITLVPHGAPGLTEAEALALLCIAPQSPLPPDGGGVESFGDNGEVWIQFSGASGLATQMTLWPGYTGRLDFRSADCASTYTLQLGSPVTKNGQRFRLDWTDAGKFPAEVDELFRGMLATFLPKTKPDGPGVLCTTTKRCVVGCFGDVAYVDFKDVGLLLWIDNQHANQPVPSIPTRFDLTAIP